MGRNLLCMFIFKKFVEQYVGTNPVWIWFWICFRVKNPEIRTAFFEKACLLLFWFYHTIEPLFLQGGLEKKYRKLKPRDAAFDAGKIPAMAALPFPDCISPHLVL